jgi:hypothetical protein
MNRDETIILYIILRESLHLDNDKTAHCAANAVQHIMLKYFMMQLLAVKTNLDTLANNDNVKITTQWLSSESKKTIISVNDNIFDKLKDEFSVGKDIFCLKDIECKDTDIETTLVFWPTKNSRVLEVLTTSE